MKLNNNMAKKETALVISEEVVMSKIYFIRGQKVMLDSDLAELYQVETKRLKEQVKRNISRFPEKYMFGLTEKEDASLRSQIATSKTGRGGTRYLPMVFTEHGVLQLSNILKSDRAEKVSFIIIDAFVRLREMLLDNTELRLAFEEIKKKTENNTKNIELVFQYLDELLEKKENPKPIPKAKPRIQIGFKIKKKK
jgi:hypothetical protein